MNDILSLGFMLYTTAVSLEMSDEPYLTALYKGHTYVRERILPLDAERYKKGDLTEENLLAKYCSYFCNG